MQSPQDTYTNTIFFLDRRTLTGSGKRTKRRSNKSGNYALQKCLGLQVECRFVLLVWHEPLYSVMRGHQDEARWPVMQKRSFSCEIRSTEARENLSCLAAHYRALIVLYGLAGCITSFQQTQTYLHWIGTERETGLEKDGMVGRGDK